MEAKVANREDWIDLSRGALMFLVYVYHSEVYYGHGHTFSWLFAPFFLIGFFFISGYLFCKDIHSVSLKKKCSSISRGLVIPYFFFSIFLILPKAAVYKTNVVQMLIDVVTFRASWFVVVIGLLQFVYALLLYKKPSYRKLIIATMFFFILGYLGVLMYRDLPTFISDSFWLHSPILPNRLPFCLNIALIMSPFFMGGILYRRYKQKINISHLFLVILCVAYLLAIVIDKLFIGSNITIVMNEYNNIGLVFLYGLLGSVIVIELSRRVKVIKAINYIGKNSILFYFLNGLMLQGTSMIMHRLHVGGGNVLSVTMVAVVACALTCPVVAFIIKYMPFVAGKRSIK